MMHSRIQTTMQLVLLVTVFCITNAQELPQHRVRKASRNVVYHHTLHHKQKPAHSKFWIPSNRQPGHTSTRGRRRIYGARQLRASAKESLTPKRTNQLSTAPELKHENQAWFVHGDASLHASPEAVYRARKEEQEEASFSLISWFQRAARRALVQEEEPPRQVYQEEDTSYAVGDKDSGYTAGDTNLTYDDEYPQQPLNDTQTWNVSTEVEFEHADDGTNNATNGNATSSVVYTTTTDESNETIPTMQPIRIRAILSEQGNGGEFLTEDERRVLFQDVLSPAIVAWSAALRVDPVVGNLTVDASQLYDGETCGPGKDSGYPSVPVPPSHFKEGIADTDVVIYLTLGFVTEPNTLNPFSEDLTGFSKKNDTASLSNQTANETGDWSFNSPNAFEDIAETERAPVEWPTCTGEYMAASSYCSTDQYDRPTAALLYLCIDDSFFLERSLERDISTVMHELGHSLGFNTQSMAHFRRPDGTPITPRLEDGNVLDTEVECTGPRHAARPSEVLPLPSEEILQFRTVRGVRVAEVVTPSVRQVVRNHFDCQSLSGAELESGNKFVANETHQVSDEEAVASCIGDHWEKRLFRIDLMNPIVDEVPFALRFSPVTLALFADSGWYQVDLSRTTFSASWGRAAGCGFVNDSCVGEYGEIAKENEQFFCNEVATSRSSQLIDEIHGCSPDMTRKAACSISQYDWELPEEYQYFNFTFGSNVGGSEPLLDFCPVYNGFANGLCKEEGNERILQVNQIEKFGAKNSRCVGGVISEQKTALCLSIACVIEDRTLRVYVDGIWHLCQYSGQVISIKSDLESSVICPDPVRTCPTFYCHRDCLGTGGICDYDTGICSCSIKTKQGNVTGKCGELNAAPDYDDVFYDDDKDQPVDDSSLSDYYVPTENALRDTEKHLEPWMIVLISLCGVLVIAVAAFVFRHHSMKRRAATGEVESFWFQRPPRDDDDDQGDDSAGPNKDKFVASMLVNMRVNELTGRTTEDSQAESILETDNSVTETESSGNCTKSSLDQSMEQSFEHFEELMIDDKPNAGFEERPEDDFRTGSELPSSIIRKRTIIHESP